ncbi:MAG TPA: class I adenylate-forming enzyme family protein, partial [Caulobacteraceae bacterium]|nr:class I adenylate-forming enzyme family protein [Caulobacteraceae bacterium]
MPAPTARTLGRLHPFTGHDVPWLLKARAETTPDHTFLIFEPFEGPVQRWTYKAFHQAVQRLAGGLAAQGVKAGEFVLLHMDNCGEFLITWHAVSRLGGVVVTTNTRSSADELAYYIAHCGAAVAVTQPRYEALVRESGPNLRWVAVTATDVGETPAAPRSQAALPFEDLAAGDPDLAPERAAEPLAPNSVQYTSGTTSRPKGVVWTHANALWGARMNAAA